MSSQSQQINVKELFKIKEEKIIKDVENSQYLTAILGIKVPCSIPELKKKITK